MHAKFSRIRKKLYSTILNQVFATLKVQNRALRQRIQNPTKAKEEVKKSPPILPLNWRNEDVVLVLRNCCSSSSTQGRAALPSMLEELMRVDVRARLEAESWNCKDDDPVALAVALGEEWFSVWHDLVGLGVGA